MSDEKTSLTAALRHLAEQERRTPSEHATPGELTAYHEGTLPPEIEARVQEHLAHCKLCSDLLLDLAGFADLAPPPGVPELTDAQVAEDWQALRARMGVEKENDKEPATVVPFRPPAAVERPRARERDFSPWKVAAAALIAVALGTAVLVLKPWAPKPEQIAAAEFSDGDRTRGEVEPSKLPDMVSTQRAHFTFHSFDSYPRYYAEIVTDNAPVWQQEFAANQTSGQPESELKPISFWVAENSLKAGRSEARLFGVDKSGKRELIGRLDFQVNAP